MLAQHPYYGPPQCLGGILNPPRARAGIRSEDHPTFDYKSRRQRREIFGHGVVTEMEGSSTSIYSLLQLTKDQKIAKRSVELICKLLTDLDSTSLLYSTKTDEIAIWIARFNLAVEYLPSYKSIYPYPQTSSIC